MKFWRGVVALVLAIGCRSPGQVTTPQTGQTQPKTPATVAAEFETSRSAVDLGLFALDSQATPQDERDEIYSLLAYAVVLADWQTTLSSPKRGHNIGSVLVDENGRIVYWGRNCNAITRNGTQHGEVRLMTGYLDQARRYELEGYTVYTTLEPCAQCSGMMIMQKVKRTVYGQTDPDFGKALERLTFDFRPKGYGPYPRPVVSQLSKSPIAGELDRAYAAQGSHGMTAWLLTDEAKDIYSKARARLHAYPLRHEENEQVLESAKIYLAAVPASYAPIPAADRASPELISLVGAEQIFAFGISVDHALTLPESDQRPMRERAQLREVRERLDTLLGSVIALNPSMQAQVFAMVQRASIAHYKDPQAATMAARNRLEAILRGGLAAAARAIFMLSSLASKGGEDPATTRLRDKHVAALMPAMVRLQNSLESVVISQPPEIGRHSGPTSTGSTEQQLAIINDLLGESGLGRLEAQFPILIERFGSLVPERNVFQLMLAP